MSKMTIIDQPEPDDGYTVKLLARDTGEHQHALVFLRAFLLFQERNAKHRDAWQPGGAKGNLVKVRLKVERAWRQLWVGGGDPTEELLDVINYTAFCVRSCDNDDWDGGWAWPK